MWKGDMWICPSYCYWPQIWLPLAQEASTRERSFDWLEEIWVLFRRLTNWGEGGLLSKSQLQGFHLAQVFLIGVQGSKSAKEVQWPATFLNYVETWWCQIQTVTHWEGLLQGALLLVMCRSTLVFPQRRARSTDPKRKISKIIYVT